MWTTFELKSLARAKAEKYGIDENKFIQVIDCETSGTWDPKIQSTYPNARDGGRELSFGLVQIHLPDHKEISVLQATDPEFALEWGARAWKEGNPSKIWTCYAG